ncbi:MAG: ATP-binding cassette domain-containing protein [Pseudomonadota bacterium]|nr:ATP-binding cassette domain-containing protein [Pseudomonadota bacterium]
MFQLDGANASYNGHAVLTDLKLEIGRGERVALVGRSGAGKSTLLNMLYEQQKAHAALIPQDSSLVKTLSVFHNIYMGRLNRHGSFYNLQNLVWPRKTEIDSVREITDKLGISDKMFELVGELSGGQQQRTAVGRALFCGGDIALGDEPVSAVDEHQARDILKALNENHETVVLAMHDMTLALEFTNRVIGLKDRRIAFDEPSADLTNGDLIQLYKA